MKTSTLKQPVATLNKEVADFIGQVFSFNNSLKLHHWHVTGDASYARHIALDQAIGDLSDVLDRLTETSYATKGDLNITIPETTNPSDVIAHAEEFYKYSETQRELFSEAFIQAIIDDLQEAIQQLLYRLKRLQ